MPLVFQEIECFMSFWRQIRSVAVLCLPAPAGRRSFSVVFFSAESFGSSFLTLIPSVVTLGQESQLLQFRSFSCHAIRNIKGSCRALQHNADFLSKFEFPKKAVFEILRLGQLSMNFDVLLL